MTPLEYVSLADHCTMGVGGPARYFVEARDEAAVLAAHEWARARRVPLRVLGGGSNLVVADDQVGAAAQHAELGAVRARPGQRRLDRRLVGCRHEPARRAADADRPGDEVPRPPRWGGYRVWAERVELWVGQPARVHDRARWTRTLTPSDAGRYGGGPWRATRLMP